MPNGLQTMVEHIETVHLNDGLILQDVFHVAAFQFSLLSVKKPNFLQMSLCILKVPSMRQHLVLGKKKDGLYFVPHTMTNKPAPSFISTYTSIDSRFVSRVFSFHISKHVFEFWHCRLGYFPFDRIKCILSVSLCDVCP